MSWQRYVERHVKGTTQVALAAKVGASQAAVSRWLKGTQGVDAAVAVAFARAVGDEPVAALVAAGFLTAEEANVRPAAAPDYSQLRNDELLELVRSRMRDEGGGAHAGSAAPNTTAGLSPHPTSIVERYLAQADGDPAAASRLLAHDGAKGANVDVFTWTAALEELHRLEQDEQDRAARSEDEEPPRMGDD